MAIKIAQGSASKSIYYDQPLHSRGIGSNYSGYLGDAYKIDGFKLKSSSLIHGRANLISDGSFDVFNGASYEHWSSENAGLPQGSISPVFSEDNTGVRLYYTGAAATYADRISIKSTTTIPKSSTVNVTFKARALADLSQLRVTISDGTTPVEVRQTESFDYFVISNQWGVYTAKVQATSAANSYIVFAIYDQVGSVTPIEIDIDEVTVMSVTDESAGAKIVLGPGSFFSNGCGVKINGDTEIEVPNYDYGGIAIYGWTDSNSNDSNVYISAEPVSKTEVSYKTVEAISNGAFVNNDGASLFSDWEIYKESADLDGSSLSLVAGDGAALKMTRIESPATPARLSVRTLSANGLRSIPPNRKVIVSFFAKASINAVALNVSINGPQLEEQVYTALSLTTTWTKYSQTIIPTPNQGAGDENSFLDFYMIGDDGESIFLDNVSVTYEDNTEKTVHALHNRALLGFAFFSDVQVNHVKNGDFKYWKDDKPVGWDVYEGSGASVVKVKNQTTHISNTVRLSIATTTFATRAAVSQGFNDDGFITNAHSVVVEFDARCGTTTKTLTVWCGKGATANTVDVTTTTTWTKYRVPIAAIAAVENGVILAYYKTATGFIDIANVRVYPLELENDSGFNFKGLKWLPAPSGSFKSFITPERDASVFSDMHPLGITNSGFNYTSSLQTWTGSSVYINTETDTVINEGITIGNEMFFSAPLDMGGQPQMVFVNGKLMRPGLDMHIAWIDRAVIWKTGSDIVQPYFTGSHGITDNDFITGSIDVISSNNIKFIRDYYIYQTGSSVIEISDSDRGFIDSDSSLLVFSDGFMLNKDRYNIDKNRTFLSIHPTLYNKSGVGGLDAGQLLDSSTSASSAVLKITVACVNNLYANEVIAKGVVWHQTSSRSYVSSPVATYGKNNSWQVWSDGRLSYPDHTSKNTISDAVEKFDGRTDQLYSVKTGSDKFEFASYPMNVQRDSQLGLEIEGGLPVSLATTASRNINLIVFESAASSPENRVKVKLPHSFEELEEASVNANKSISEAIYRVGVPTFGSGVWQGAGANPPTPRHYDTISDGTEFSDTGKIFNGNYFLTINSLMGFKTLDTGDYVYVGYEDIPSDQNHPHKALSVFGVLQLTVDLMSDVPLRSGKSIVESRSIMQVDQAIETLFKKEALDSTGASFLNPVTGRPTLTVSNNIYFGPNNPIMTYANLASMAALWGDALGLYTTDEDGIRHTMLDAGIERNANDGSVSSGFGALLSPQTRGLLNVSTTDSVVIVMEKFLGYRQEIKANFGYGSGMMWGTCAFNMEDGEMLFKPMTNERYPRLGIPPYTERGGIVGSGGVYREYHDDFVTQRTNYSENGPHWSRKSASTLDEGWCKVPSSGLPSVSDILSRNRNDARYSNNTSYAWYRFNQQDRSSPFDYGWYGGHVGYAKPSKDLKEDKETYKVHTYLSDPWTTPYAQANPSTGFIDFSYLGDNGLPKTPGYNNFKSGSGMYMHNKGVRNNIICWMSPMRELRGSFMTTWREDHGSTWHTTDYYYHWGDTNAESDTAEAHPKCIEYFDIYDGGKLSVRPYVNYSHYVEPVFFFLIGPTRGFLPRFAGHVEGASGQRTDNFYTVRNKDILVTKT